MRSHNWSQTPLGAVETWPQSLRSTLSICLNSRFPIAIYWGPDYVLLYNDAWRPIVGNKHPWSLGCPGREVWPEIWDDIGPELASVLETGKGTFHNDELLSMHRFGYVEECFFEYTFNPIQGEEGTVEGVFNIVTETTYRVLNERRARLLREIASKTGAAKTTEEACALMVETFKSDPADIPFALLYLIDQPGESARLCGSTEPIQDYFISPAVIDLAAEDPNTWPIALVARTGQCQVVHNLASRFGSLPGSPWPEPPQEAMVLPISSTGVGKVIGVLVAVASPRRKLDDIYQDFFNQVAGQTAMAIANAQAYEEERKRAEALAELDRAKTVFFSNVSHEFRTPLTLMLSPLEEMVSAPSPSLAPEQHQQLQMVHRNGLRLLKLVNTLLDFSRIEAGRIQAIYEPTDLAALTAHLAGVFRSAIEQAGMRLIVDCPPLPEPVFVDREMWEKIVFNLLSNAFKFTFEGEIAVRLRWVDGRDRGDKSEEGDKRNERNEDNQREIASASPASLPLVLLEVRDTGTGIPANELPHIFERFHRVKEARGRSYEGSGIGLSLVQELVQLHGGTIEVSSIVDQGTCFTIAIPSGFAHLPSDRLRHSNSPTVSPTRTLASTATGATSYVTELLRWLPEESERPGELISERLDESTSEAVEIIPTTFQKQAPPTPIETQPDSPIPSSYLPHILLVDDNADMRDYVKRLLSQQYDVKTVVDGVAALAAIRQRLPDLVLTDVMMPGLDGFGLLRKLRANPQTQKVPIILLSARAGEESRIEGLEAGADDYLIKPFSARELLARVEATLKLAQIRREAEQAAHKNEERLLFALEAARMVAWEWNLKTGISQRLGNAAEILGLGTSSADDFYQLIHPEDRPVVQAAIARAIQGEAIYDVEFRVLTADGRTIWLADKAHLRYDEQGQPSHLAGVCVDITERKQAEAALQQAYDELRQQADQLEQTNITLQSILKELQLAQEELYQQNEELAIARELAEVEGQRYQDLFNFAPDGYVITDANGLIQEANQAFAALVNLDQSYLVGKPLAIYICAPGHHTFRRLLDQLRQQPQGQKLQTDTLSLRSPSQEPIPVEITGTAVWDSQAQIVGMRWLIQDITERKQIEAALKTSEERLRFAVEGAALGTWEYDLATGQIIWSERCKIMFGAPLDAEIDYAMFIRSIHPDDRDRIHTAVERAITEQEVYDVEMRSLWSDGSVHWVRSIGRAQYNHADIPERMIGVAFDITNRKQAEEALRNSAERLSLALAAARLGDWSWDAKTDGVTLSERAAAMFGIPAGPYMTWTQMQTLLHEADRERVRLQVEQAIANHSDYDIEYRVIHIDGTQRWIAAKGRAQFDSDGQVLGMQGVVQDITERKQAELEREHLLARERHYVDQLQGLMTAALAINSALSVEQVLQMITEQAASIIGAHQSVTSMTIDQNWAQAINAIYLSDKYAQWRNYDEKPDGSGIYAYICELNRPMRMTQAELEAHPHWKGFGNASDKHPPMRGWLAAPLMGRDGHNIGLIQLSDKHEGEFTAADEAILVQLAQMASVAVENARLYEAERQARSAAEASGKEAQAANRIKDEFLAVLSHELRSPLNPILGWSKLLQTGKLDPLRTQQALATIERNAKLQAELIEDLLDVSRILQGKLRLTISAVDLAATIRAAIETMRLAAEAKSIQIEANLDRNVGQISGDATRIQQVVWNLLSNAVKFTPPGGHVTVRLDTDPTAPAQQPYAQLTVSDTGKGIAPHFLPYVFDYFRQEDGATTRKFGGLGLGLAIVRHLVELHGGTISADSAGEGQGASFTVRLPLMASQPQPSLIPVETERPANLNGLKILIVDDETDTREFITFLLEQAGAHVTAVTSASEGLAALTQFKPDLLLSDIGMPELDGYWLLRQVRSLPPHQGGTIPAIALTAYAGEIDYQQAMAAGFQRHVPKPVEPDLLVRAIADLVQQIGGQANP
jgi:PAS domain S-box-containing protein